MPLLASKRGHDLLESTAVCHVTVPSIDVITMQSLYYYATLLLVLLMCACGASDSHERVRDETAMPIAAYVVEPLDFARSLRLTGEVEPRARIQVAARTGGAVQAVRVDIGDRVEVGDLLAELDREEVKAELERAQADQALSQATYERLADLYRRQLVSTAEYDEALASVRVAGSLVRLWETRRDHGVIVAPAAGTITARYIEPGEAIQTHDRVFELIADGELRVRLQLTELDAVHLQPGEAITLRFDALADHSFTGTVERVAPAAVAGSRWFRVDVLIPADAMAAGVRAGFTARAAIRVDARPGTLAVPGAAIGRSSDGHFVLVVDDADRLVVRNVQTGITRNGATAILDGIEEGDVVLATNPQEMRPGQAVRVVRWRSL